MNKTIRITTRIRRYSVMFQMTTIEERYQYLKLSGFVGEKTFGADRYFNQSFYHSQQWKRVRNIVINRDEGCDLGIPGFEIHDKILIHHMNPLMIGDLEDGNPDILNPEFLICTSKNTHLAIHYGDVSLLPKVFVSRTLGDTKLW